MLFQTPTQFVILALLLVIGWLFGLASHPGGRKWRTAYDEQRLNHAGYRDDAEEQLKAADRRVAELERDNNRLRADLDKARSEHHSSVGPTVAGAAVGAVAASALHSDKEPQPAAEPEARRGWFSWPSKGDDLSRIRGLDSASEAKLRKEGVSRYSDLASLSDTDEIALERRIDLPAGFIQREQWREQASLLADGKADEHGDRFS